MSTDTHRQIANDIWSICNLLRGPYKRNEYRKVILPLTVLRRFDGLLAPTKAKALETFNQYKGKPESIIRSVMQGATGYPFYNLSKLEFRTSQKGVNSLLDDPGHLAPNLNSYINGFSPNVRAIMERFAFDQQIARMAEKNLLFKVVQKFATFDLSFSHLAPDQAAMQMGYVFEELIRIGAEQSNEEAGEHFTPREVIKLMVNLLLSPEQDLRRSHVVKTIYDPACGTGGMLSVAEKYIRDLNSDAKPLLYGQDWNDEAWAVCRSDMLIKGEDADNIARGDTFTKDAHARDEQGQKRRFDYMLANPPFGVEWKQQQRYIEDEAAKLGYRELNYGLSKIEVQKLAYFLQEAGGPLDLPFVKHHYGPYSDTLRHALNTMEGHFIRGLGDGVVEAEIEPTEDALAEAEAFIAEKQHSELAGQVDRVGRLIDGYQSSYGMELLASVHWVAAHEADVRSLGDAVAAVHAWNDRKRHLMKPEHIASAWKRLGDEGWLVAEQQPRAAL